VFSNCESNETSLKTLKTPISEMFTQWRTKNFVSLDRQPLKRYFWRVVRFAGDNVYDASAFSGFELEILEFELKSSLQVTAFNGFLSAMQLIRRELMFLAIALLHGFLQARA
jgi:hypothetical protein